MNTASPLVARAASRRLSVTMLAALAMAGVLTAASPAANAASTKDIVLDRVTAPAVGNPEASADAMAVSILLESPDGTLRPYATSRTFSTGDRFRVKLLASRTGRVSLYNTNPAGVLGREPIWQGEVQPGLETISPRLRLEGQRGVDQLHVLLEPTQPAQSQGVWGWLTSWFERDKSSAKDIRLDVQDTDTATYLMQQQGQGLVTTVTIAHQ
ncbi:MAG: hypothetical protein H6930_16725 [Rhodoferax sp.]|nr:hypothetical protein [Rhodoferax sp.]